jgi:transcriptional regulator with XRE-family HTH domain
MEIQEEKVISNIMQIRHLLKLTQKDVGVGIGVTEASYNRIESGKIALSYNHLTRIASFFKMSVIDLISYPETYAPSKTQQNTKVLVELDVSNDEFIKMGLKDKVIQILNK